MEEDPETGIIKTYTMPIDIDSGLPTPSGSTGRTPGLSKGVRIALDLAVFAASGAPGGYLIARGVEAAGIPLALVSAGSLVKLVIDIIR